MTQPASLSKGRPIKARVNKLSSANVCQVACVDPPFVVFCVWAISRTSVPCSPASTLYHRFRFGPLSLWATAPIGHRLPVQQPCAFHSFSLCIPVPSVRRLQTDRFFTSFPPVPKSQLLHKLENPVIQTRKLLVTIVGIGNHRFWSYDLVVGCELGGRRANSVPQPHAHEYIRTNPRSQVLDINIP